MTHKRQLLPTTVILALYVRLLTVTLSEFPMALRLMGPNHEARVTPTHCHQKAVVMAPPHIGDLCTVGHIALELSILALRKRNNIYLRLL